ncbi:MAG: photoactive yellow protein [Planctomycetota bacterium]|nr:photoactive yellow protein [Planctomycetota bacterium]
MSTATMLRDRIAGRTPSPAAAPSSFVPPEVFGACGSLTRADVDSFDFGAVKVDDAGKILLYNRCQSELAGVAPATAEGKNFFTQVAPCSNNGLFFGAFKRGVAAGSLNTTFPYTFTYKMKPTNVQIHLYRDNASKTNWIFISKS